MSSKVFFPLWKYMFPTEKIIFDFKIDYTSIKKSVSTYCTVQGHCATDIYTGTWSTRSYTMCIKDGITLLTFLFTCYPLHLNTACSCKVFFSPFSRNCYFWSLMVSLVFKGTQNCLQLPSPCPPWIFFLCCVVPFSLSYSTSMLHVLRKHLEHAKYITL